MPREISNWIFLVCRGTATWLCIGSYLSILLLNRHEQAKSTNLVNLRCEKRESASRHTRAYSAVGQLTCSITSISRSSTPVLPTATLTTHALHDAGDGAGYTADGLDLCPYKSWRYIHTVPCCMYLVHDTARCSRGTNTPPSIRSVDRVRLQPSLVLEILNSARWSSL